MSAAVDDVHHRNGERVGVAATDVAIEGQTESVGSSLGTSEADAEDGVGTELALGGSAVQSQHLVVQCALVQHAVTLEGGSDDFVHVLHSLQGTLAEVAVLVAVAEFEGFVLTSAGTGGNSSTTHYTIFQNHVDFYSRVATRIKDLTSNDFFNLHLLEMFIKCE